MSKFPVAAVVGACFVLSSIYYSVTDNNVVVVPVATPKPTLAPTPTPSPLDVLMMKLEEGCKKDNYKLCHTSLSPDGVQYNK